ncbi:MAG: hypothetical protein AAGF85_05350 [Bacteroidota bacterium]
MRSFFSLNYTIVAAFIFSMGCSAGDEAPEPEVELPVPTLSLPVVLISEVIADWSDYSGAVAYELDVASDRGFTELLPGYSSLRTTESRLLIENLDPATTYHIRIRAELEDGELTGNSNIQTITTLEEKDCADPSEFIFIERGGILRVEFEDAVFGDTWSLRNDSDNTSGRGYMVWTGPDFFSQPSSDLVIYSMIIVNPGTYRFIWNSAVTLGESGTEHNDTWLRFPDATDYFGKKGNEIIYPKGTGKTPNPEGASVDGWFKIYRSGNDLDFKWQARTSDRDPHEIFVTFNRPGNYTMEISARSNGHGIDQFVLFLEDLQQTTATSTDFSEIICL